MFVITFMMISGNSEKFRMLLCGSRTCDLPIARLLVRMPTQTYTKLKKKKRTIQNKERLDRFKVKGVWMEL